MPRGKWWFSKRSKIPKAPIPELPDEIWEKIFLAVPAFDRRKLCLVSRRFYRLDLATGAREFSDVSLKLNEHTDSICCTISGSGGCKAKCKHKRCASWCEFEFAARAHADIRAANPNINRFLHGASAESLSIVISETRAALLPELMHTLVNTLSYTRLSFYFEGKWDFSSFLIRFFTNFRNSNVKRLHLYWVNLKRQNISRLQEAFNMLPKFDYLVVGNCTQDKAKMELIHSSDPLSFVLTGPLICPLISAAEEVFLNAVHLSSQEIVDAFEMVCASNVDFKRVQMTVDSHSLFQLYEILKDIDRYRMTHDSVRDEVRGFTMVVDYKYRPPCPTFSPMTACVSFHKLDSRGNTAFHRSALNNNE